MITREFEHSREREYRKLDRLFYSACQPPPLWTVAQWAENRRILTGQTSARPGPWRNEVTPYLVPVMNALDNPQYEFVLILSGSQIGKSEVGNNWTGRTIDIDPNPMIFMLPTVRVAEDYSKQRFATLLETPQIAAKLGGNSYKQGRTARGVNSNTTLTKMYPGGMLLYRGSNSVAGLKSTPAKYLVLDEASEYKKDVGGQGCPIKLVLARTRTFPDRKVLMTSTPTEEGKCQITEYMKTCNEYHYFVPCPHCGHYQTLEEEYLILEEDYSRAYFVCKGCNGEIEERHKPEMLADYETRCVRKGYPRRIGFYIPSFYSPLGFLSWLEIAIAREEAAKDPIAKKTYVNTMLAKPTKDFEDDDLNAQILYSRREDYPLGTVPGGKVLTAGVDVQGDRIEVEIVSWGEGLESWSVTYVTLSGSPYETEIWSKLAKVLETKFDGKAVTLAFIDSGYATSEVYKFCRRFKRAVAVKGSHTTAQMVSKPRRLAANKKGRKYEAIIRNIGVDVVKSQILGWAKLEQNEDGSFPPGYMHFPQYDVSYFEQLLAERKVEKVVRGRRKEVFIKVQDRNEALDCRVYARAAAFAIGLDHLPHHRWESL